jgi:hypothetical protein
MQRFLKPLPWILLVFLGSRLLILGTIALIAPHLPLSPTHYSYTIIGFQSGFTPHTNWSLLTHWDGAWYKRIAEQGYGDLHGKGMQSVVFFPLYPLLCRGLMQLGLSFEVAGSLVSNLSFLAALLLLYGYLEDKYDRTLARWSTLVLAIFPCALYTAVTYTESLFLLTTLATLIAFDRRQYAQTTLWGILATACRPPGMLLVPALLWASYRDRHPPRAYLASLLMASGFVGFLIYCGTLGNPWATFQGHQAWSSSIVSWPEVIARLPHLNSQGLGAWVRLLSFGGALALIWRSPQVLTRSDRTYGLITLGFLLASNSTEGLIRYLYALAPLSWALGFHLARWKPLGSLAIGAFVLGLVGFSLRFAWWLWVS